MQLAEPFLRWRKLAIRVSLTIAEGTTAADKAAAESAAAEEPAATKAAKEAVAKGTREDATAAKRDAFRGAAKFVGGVHREQDRSC